MELHCDPKTTASTTQDDKILNVNTEELQPKKLTSAVSGKRIRDIADNENQWKAFDLNHQMGREQYENLIDTYNLMNYV